MSAKKSAPELPEAGGKKPPGKKTPKISKFAEDTEPALPEGKSSIQIIKDTDERDLSTAAADANKDLQSAASELDDAPPPAPAEDELGDLNDDTIEPISDELTEPLEEEENAVTPADDPGQEEGVDTVPPAPANETELSDDEITTRAVEEIIAEESDAVLEAEDKKRAADEAPAVTPKRPGKLRARLKQLWANPKARWGIIIGSVFALLAVALIPHSRYFVLNTAQVRSSLSVRVIDGNTLQPLKNVSVRAGGASAQTDSDGTATLGGVRLGSTKLVIDKRAFAKIERDITVGWGSNPLGEFRAEAVGTQYTFYTRDYLSGKPIARSEAASGDGNASSDGEGKLVLTLDTAELEDGAQINVDITAANYRKETVNLTVNNREAQSVELVPARRAAFVSKRSGNYDVYTVDIDGKNEQKVVSGTGLEREDIALVAHSSQDVAALVSTRENVRNSSGYLLSTLYIIDTKRGEYVKADQSEKIQIIGWSDSGHLVYVKIAAGASGTDSKRHRLMSFNNNDFADVKELASSNSFNDVVMIKNRVYYAPSNVFQEDVSPGVFAVSPDGDNRQTLLDKEAYVLQRSSYDVLDINTGQEWHTYTTGSDSTARPAQAPSSQTSKLFADNPKSNFSLWVEDRDGKGVLLTYDRSDKSDAALVTHGGLREPVYWLNDRVAVFRVRDSRETADYVVSVDGGEARKITDVTDTSGISRWFYY